MIDPQRYRIRPGQQVDLASIPSRDDGGLARKAAEREQQRLAGEMFDLQSRLFAEKKQGLLIVLQAMDAAGKDSTIRRVFSHLSPQGCRVSGFRAPSRRELAHDYLWRIHQRTPYRGFVRIFNRSHYEDVLVVRVKNLVPKERWEKRYDHINDFERLLSDEGTRILKFYIHVSKAYQKERFQRRLDRPDKHWKFNPSDLEERARWDEYMAAFEDVFTRCSTEHAPWYVIPSERRWYRDLVMTRIVCDALVEMDPRYPEAEFDPSTIVIE